MKAGLIIALIRPPSVGSLADKLVVAGWSDLSSHSKCAIQPDKQTNDDLFPS